MWRLYKLILDRFCAWAEEREVDPLLIEDYKQERLLKVQKPTVNRELTAIRSMFKMAFAWKLVDAKPCEGVKQYRGEPGRKAPEFFTARQVDLLLHKSQGSYLHDLILLDVYTGLRRTELAYLEWRDLNFENWTVTVQAKDELGWHTLRHTYASHLVMKGRPLVRCKTRKEGEL